MAHLGLWVSAPPQFKHLLIFHDNLRDDSTNSGYEDQHNNEHSVVTKVNTIRIANQSVSKINIHIPKLLLFHCTHAFLQVKAWPGQLFLIELTGWDQFSHPTIANARLSFSGQDQVQ